MRKARVDVFIDEVRLVEEKIAFQQNRHGITRMLDRELFWLAMQIDIDHLEVHPLLVEHYSTAMAIGAGQA